MATETKDYVAYVALFITTAGWIGNGMVLRNDVMHIQEVMDDKTQDRFYGHQGRELERRIEKLEKDLPPVWLVNDVNANASEVRRLDDRADGMQSRIQILDARTEEMRKYIDSKYPDWRNSNAE